ncbi:MAG: SpoIVB peptidase [Oscillospiraceae bacterium]|nr:SpoIVB peptidase [Oscillospiraceae bacterium]
MKKIIKTLSGSACVFSLIYYLFIGYFYFTIPENFISYENEEFSINQISVLSATYTQKSIRADNDLSETKKVSVKLLGVFPIKEATVNLTDSKTVNVGGTPFGIKFLTKGVLVTSLSSVTTEKGLISPAENAGIIAGDLILSIGGKAVSNNDDVVSAVNSSAGNPLEIELIREDKNMSLSVSPALTLDGSYKIGIWVKDSAAGIGTLTFALPNQKIFAGLGHPICDSGSGEIMSILSGEITSAEIFGVNKGKVGTPGELKGKLSGADIGSLKLNCECGVYGELFSEIKGEEIELGFKQTITLGEAQIITTVDSEGPKLYNICIEKINLSDDSMTKNMVIRITDPNLLDKTGGIVQGMSGSPIIQNGRLIGAVTHVFVNDPTRGYGIFAENMLSTAQSVRELKEAS